MNLLTQYNQQMIRLELRVFIQFYVRSRQALDKERFPAFYFYSETWSKISYDGFPISLAPIIKTLYTLLSSSRWPKTSKLLTSSSVKNLRIFEVQHQKNLNFLNLNYPQNLTLNIKNAVLILTSNFQRFLGFVLSKVFLGSSKNLGF